MNDKEKYVLHYRNLRQYLSLGLKLKKVHRVLEFEQSPWLKSYIELNTELRRNAKCKFDEDQAKLMNNSFFGKTCEDVRKYKDVKICMDKTRIQRIMKKEKCDGWKIYNENLAAVLMDRNTVKLNKPRYIGTAVLGLSKEIMYNFHYNFMMKEYSNVKLLFTDTDSFCYQITTDNDLYKDIKGNQWFDFSNYIEVHTNFDDSKMLIPGFFKDEFGGKFIHEFVGLRAKMYSILPLEGTKKAACKGIDEIVKNEVLTHNDFKTSLHQEIQYTNQMVRIQQENHKNFTVKIEKKSLSPFNDKKWIRRDGDDFISYSFGHNKIVEQ